MKFLLVTWIMFLSYVGSSQTQQNKAYNDIKTEQSSTAKAVFNKLEFGKPLEALIYFDLDSSGGAELVKERLILASKEMIRIKPFTEVVSWIIYPNDKCVYRFMFTGESELEFLMDLHFVKESRDYKIVLIETKTKREALEAEKESKGESKNNIIPPPPPPPKKR